MTEASASNTPKPTPTLMEDLENLYVIGGLDDEFDRLHAALERLEELDRNSVPRSRYNAVLDEQTNEAERLKVERETARTTLDALRAEVAALTKKLEEAERFSAGCVARGGELIAERDALARAIDEQLPTQQCGLLRSQLDASESRATELAKKLEEAEKKWKNEKRAHYHTIGQRDLAEEWSDKLAYAIAPMEEIGEHSSANNPWENALALADDWYEKAMAERSRATELAARVTELAEAKEALEELFKPLALPPREGPDYHGHTAECRQCHFKWGLDAEARAGYGKDEKHWEGCAYIAAKKALSSTPAADLAAHDDRIRREALEEALIDETGACLKCRAQVKPRYPGGDQYPHRGYCPLSIAPQAGEKESGLPPRCPNCGIGHFIGNQCLPHAVEKGEGE